MRKKRILSVLLSAFLVTGTAVQCLGATTQDKISDARARQQQNRSSLEATQEKIEELEGKKGESETYLEDLKSQLSDLKSSLEQLQKDYDEKQAELTQLQEDLTEAKADEERQYEDMKVRIRYMYENSTTNYMNMFFESDSIAEFLNQAENISKMTEYDRDMLDTYRETKETIATKEQQVAQEKDAIVELQRESEDKQAAIEELVEATYLQIREYQESIQSEESAESELLAQITAEEESINALLKQAKEEEAAARLAAQKAAEEAAARKAAEKAAAEKAAAEKAAAEKAAAEQAAKEQALKEEQSKPDKNETTDSGSDQNSSSEEKEQEGDSLIDTSQGKYLGRFKLTAYCTCSKCCGKWAGGGTASGAAPTPGRTVAMAGVPFGTKLKINGHVYTVEDRGTAYGHVDILMSSHAEALRFGMKYADVYQVN